MRALKKVHGEDDGLWGRKGINRVTAQRQGAVQAAGFGEGAAYVTTTVLTPECKFHEDRVFLIFTEASYTERCREGKDFFHCDKYT